MEDGNCTAEETEQFGKTYAEYYHYINKFSYATKWPVVVGDAWEDITEVTVII